MEEIEIKQLKLWYQKPGLWIGIGVTGCLILLAMPHVMRTYHQWSGRRYLQRAKQFYDKGEYQQAILNARGALARDAKDVEALRVIAKTAEAMGSPQALEFRRQVDALKPGDLENLLGMAAAYLKAGDATAADGVLKSIKPADQSVARYHDLAAGVAMANKDFASAGKSLAEAQRIDPGNDEYRLKLAALQIESKNLETRGAAMAILEKLSAEPAMRLRALRVLLGDAMGRGEAARARDLAETVASDSQATFADKLNRLAILRAGKTPIFSSLTAERKGIDPEFTALLGELQKTAAAKPEELFQLLSWMNEHDLALLVPEWIATLPAEAIAKPPVCVAVADAYARASDWKGLRPMLEKGNWQQLDFLRMAWLARTLDRLDDAAGSRTAWSKAMAGAESRPDSLETLSKEVLKWGWESKVAEPLQKLAASERCPRWVLDYLWKSALKKEDTAELFKVSRLVLNADPKSVSGRNNYISLALLTGQDVKAARTLAETLYQENPANPNVASTYGFALYLQGKPEDAVTLMEKLSPAQLREPSAALYYGIFLAAAGQSERAEEYLQAGEAAPQLPEEKALGNFLRAAVQARGLERRGDAAGSNASWGQAFAVAQANPDWLELLGRLAQQWGWSDKAEAVVVKLANAERCPRWATGLLWTAVLKTGDSAQLHKASKLIQAIDPKDTSARGNFILLSLLTRREGDSSGRLAEALARENSGDPLAVSTQALSLVQQGKAEDATALLGVLKPEQLRQAPAAFYYGVALAVSGKSEQAIEYLEIGAPGLRFPEEKAMLEILRLAQQSRTAEGAGDTAKADAVWEQAMASTQKRSDWLEMLGRIAVKTEASKRAEAALWKLADDPACPLWAIDYLSTAAEKSRDATQRYKAARLKSKADPRNVAAKSSFIRLALLTGHGEDFPHRLAESISQDNPGNASATVAYGLSLYQRGKEREAVTALEALRPAQLREPYPAFYYGVFLTSIGQPAKAQEYLDLGAKAPLLPEEEGLLTKARQAPQVGSLR